MVVATMKRTMATVDTRHPPIVILGPTAGGKTAVSIGLAKALPGGGECISADSMQVYRGMDIGTATPTIAEQDHVPHHLLNVADPSGGGFTVDVWLSMADAAAEAIDRRGSWPIIVGGTNLYVQAFLYGLFDGPDPDAQLRSQLEEMSLESLRNRLDDVDKASAARIHPNDRRRTQRAVEVFEQTGTPLSQFQTQWDVTKAPRRDAIVIGLEWETEAINTRINARVKKMIGDGLVDEVQTLLETRQLGPQSAEGVGYKQVIDALEGRISLDEAIEQVKIRTRRLGKQQRTWLRRFRHLPGSTWIQATDSSTEDVVSEALTAILEHPLSGGGDGVDSASEAT